jgi:hypothetical protein
MKNYNRAREDVNTTAISAKYYIYVLLKLAEWTTLKSLQAIINNCRFCRQ